MTDEQVPAWNSPTAELTALESGLTGAARETLNRYIRDLRIRIVREAYRGQTPGRARVDATELNAAIKRIRAADRLIHWSVSDLFVVLARPLVARIATSIAVAVSLLAVVATLRESASSQVFAAVAGGALSAVAAITAALFAFEIVRTRRSRAEDDSIIASREFVRRLAAVEASSLELAARLVGVEDSRSIGLGRAHAVLDDFGVWSADDVNTFRQLLRLRNQVVHEDSLSLSDDDLAFAMAELLRLSGLLLEPRIAIEAPPKQIAV